MTNIVLPRAEMHAADGHVTAWADAIAQTDRSGSASHVLVRVSVAGGHLPPGTNSQLMRAVLDVVRSTTASKMTVVLPIGDSERWTCCVGSAR